MAAVIAAFVSLAHAQGPNGPQSAPRPAQIECNGVLILIRQSCCVPRSMGSGVCSGFR